MKKLITFTSLFLLTASLSAQEIGISPEMGITVNDMSQKLKGIHRETYSQAGFRLGVGTHFHFSENFLMNTGLFLSFNNGAQTRGSSSYYSGAGIPTSESDKRFYHYSYLQIPIFFTYKTKNEYNDPYFFFGVGPTLSMLVGGKYVQEYYYTMNGKDKLTERNEPLAWKSNVGDDLRTDRLRGFDVGASAMVGYQTTFGFNIKLHYTHGLLNIAPEGNANNEMRNSSMGVTFGFLLKSYKENAWD